MKWKFYLVGLLSFLSLSVSAQKYKLEGKIGDKYSIVIELQNMGDGIFNGRYAYNSTLRRDGNVNCSWLNISPSQDAPYSEWVVTDCKGNKAEVWYNIRFSDNKYLSARMINVKGRSYDVTATVTGASSNHSQTQSQSLEAYYKEHLSDYAGVFHMFKDKRIADRLQKMMGASDFEALKNISQVETPIQFNNGMFWASGFKAHQCCDPITVWAYDSYTNNFYVWIRKDDREYWWSESGNVPLKFRELVNNEV